MGSATPHPSLVPRDLFAAWWRILSGRVPMLSIEITRECPLSCPGCYAYGEMHLGGEVTLRELHDLRGDALVEGVLELVRKHQPIHVSLVGGEPLIRHRELSVKGGVKLDHWGGGKLDQTSVWKLWINREGGVWSGGLRSGLRTAFRPERKTPPSAREVVVI